MSTHESANIEALDQGETITDSRWPKLLKNIGKAGVGLAVATEAFVLAIGSASPGVAGAALASMEVGAVSYLAGMVVEGINSAPQPEQS